MKKRKRNQINEKKNLFIYSQNFSIVSKYNIESKLLT